MKPFEQRSHVFIIRVWWEAREIQGQEPAVRGTIEHVSSGQKLAVDDLEKISTFINEMMQRTRPDDDQPGLPKQRVI